MLTYCPNENEKSLYNFTRLKDKRIFLAVTLLLFNTEIASAKPRFVGSNAKMAIVGLSPDEGCLPAKITGKIVKREFARNGLFINSVIIEEKSGQRSFINVDDSYQNSDAATVGSVKNAVETTLNVGKRVTLGVTACGAAGRTMTIDTIKPL